jgi:hypothetical protein
MRRHADASVNVGGELRQRLILRVDEAVRPGFSQVNDVRKNARTSASVVANGTVGNAM